MRHSKPIDCPTPEAPNLLRLADVVTFMGLLSAASVLALVLALFLPRTAEAHQDQVNALHAQMYQRVLTVNKEVTRYAEEVNARIGDLQQRLVELEKFVWQLRLRLEQVEGKQFNNSPGK